MATTRRPIKLTGIGCGGILLITVLVLGIFRVQYSVLSNEAIQTRKELEGAHPTQASFTPPPDGAIPSDRMERFLAVRRTLYPRCRDFATLRGGYDSMGRSGELIKKLFRLGQDVAEFSIARNETLIRNEMGLGEYTWLYVMAYYSWLGHDPIGFPIATKEGARIFNQRVRGEVQDMMRRHAEALQSSRGESVEPPFKNHISLLREEIEAMERDPDRIPFQDGLPEVFARSLEPYRQELASLSCPEVGELEIMRTEKRSIRFEHN